MNYNENSILKKTIELLKELGSSEEDYKPQKAVFEEKEILARGEGKGEVHPCWIVMIDDTSFFNTIDFITFSDETGEPLYIQTKHSIFLICKNESAKYSLKIN
jgi:hypothetical protein